MLELANSVNKWRGWGGWGGRGGVEEGRGWGMGAVGTHIAVVTAPVLLRLLLRATIQACKCKFQNRAFYKLSRLLFSGVQQSVLAVCASKHTPLFNILALCPIQQGCGCNRAFK